MQRKTLLHALPFFFLSVTLALPNFVHAQTIEGSGASKTRQEWSTSATGKKTTVQVQKKDQNGNPVYQDPDLSGGWQIDTGRGSKAEQASSTEPWHLTRKSEVDTPGTWTDQTYNYTVQVPAPYDESKWTNQPITIRATDSDYLTAEPSFVGSNVASQLITRENAKDHSESLPYSLTASTHTAWDGSTLSPLKVASSTGTTGTTATDTVEGATEWKIWTRDNLYTDNGLYPKNLGLPYTGHYTAENHLLKYDATKPTVTKLSIRQNRLKDVGITGDYLAENQRENQAGESRSLTSDQSIANTLDSKMTTTIAITLSDQNRMAFHGANDVSGIQNMVVTIHGNNGKVKTLTYNNKGSSDFTRSNVTRNREDSADAFATYTWTGNLYKDPALSGATDLIVTISVSDQGGNKTTSFDQSAVTNNHSGDGIGTNATYGKGDKTHLRNFDAISTIYRNDTLNEKYNGTYITKNPNQANANAKTYWERAGYSTYAAFFNANRNGFLYSEYATVKSISYGSGVDGYSTDFDYGNAGMATLSNQKRATYDQSPVMDRTFGETDYSEAGHTTSQTFGIMKVLTYNTRFPIVSQADKGTYRTGTLRYGLDLTLAGSLEKAYVKPDYRINTNVLPDTSGLTGGPGDDPLHVRISTNHGNGSLKYK